MDPKRIVMLVVGASVMVLIFSAILVPIINDATATEKTLTNTGYYTMDKVATDAEFTLTWDYTDPTSVKINEETINLANVGLTAGKSYTIFGADNFVLRLYWSGTPYCQYFGDASITPSFIQATVATNSKLTATVSNGEITFASTDPSYTTPATIPLKDTAYCINPNGDGAFVMKKSDGTAYIESNTDIIVLDGITTLTANDVGIYADGTINGDLNAVTFRGTGTYDVTFEDFVYTTEPVSGVTDLVKLEKVEFTATQNNTDYTVTYSYFIVPAEVTAGLAVTPDSATRAMLNAIPIIAMIGIILAVVGVAIVGRNDY